MLAVERRNQLYGEYYGHSYDQEDTSYETRKKSNKQKKISTAQKAKLILAMSLIGALCILIIVSSAYTSQIKYNINKSEDKRISLQKEIENIKIEIQKGNEIKQLEAKAIDDLGMTYPNMDQVVFLSKIKVDDTDFGALLREQAFN